MPKSFCNRVNNLKGREGWSAFLGTNHFNKLQSLIVEAILITTDSESAFIFPSMAAMNFHREFSVPSRRAGSTPAPGTNDVNYRHSSFESEFTQRGHERSFCASTEELPAQIARKSNARRRSTSALGHER